MLERRTLWMVPTWNLLHLGNNAQGLGASPVAGKFLAGRVGNESTIHDVLYARSFVESSAPWALAAILKNITPMPHGNFWGHWVPWEQTNIRCSTQRWQRMRTPATFSPWRVCLERLRRQHLEG